VSIGDLFFRKSSEKESVETTTEFPIARVGSVVVVL
jgi:hypothetical protein